MTLEEESNPSLRERKKKQVRDKILEVSQALFKVHGYSETSMDDIARGADIARKTLFNYMSSKEAILTALVDQLVRSNMPDWLEKDEPTYNDVRDVIAPHLTRRLETIAQHRWLLTMAAEYTSYYNAAKSEFVDATLNSNFHARVLRIQAVQEHGRIRSDISAHEISCYYEAFRDSTIQRWLLKPSSTEAELHQSFDNAMKVLLQGLMPE